MNGSPVRVHIDSIGPDGNLVTKRAPDHYFIIYVFPEGYLLSYRPYR